MTTPTGPPSPGAGNEHRAPSNSGESLAASPGQRIANQLLEAFPLDTEAEESGFFEIHAATEVPDGLAHPDHEINAQLTRWRGQESFSVDRAEIGSREVDSEGRVTRTNLLLYPDASGELQRRKRVTSDVPGVKKLDETVGVTGENITDILAEIQEHGIEPLEQQASAAQAP